MQNKNNSFGQYFTPDFIADFMTDLCSKKDKSIKVLDPCCGTGVFLNSLKKRGYQNITALEIGSYSVLKPRGDLTTINFILQGSIP